MDLDNVLTQFRVEDDKLVFISPEGSEHEVTRMMILANGVQDTGLIHKTLPNGDVEVEIKKRGEITSEKNVYFPEGDVFYADISPPYNNAKSMYLDIESDPTGSMKLMVKEIMRRFGHLSKRGSNYEAYAGSNYGTGRT